jgi:hypothetical protein
MIKSALVGSTKPGLGSTRKSTGLRISAIVLFPTEKYTDLIFHFPAGPIAGTLNSHLYSRGLSGAAEQL